MNIRQILGPVEAAMESQLQTSPGWLITLGSLGVFIGTSFYTINGYPFLVTEVFVSLAAFFIGVGFLREGYRNIEMEGSEETEEKEVEQMLEDVEEQRSASPFYFELEPIIQRRDLPPIPKDIGRIYDPEVVDKV